MQLKNQLITEYKDKMNKIIAEYRMERITLGSSTSKHTAPKSEDSLFCLEEIPTLQGPALHNEVEMVSTSAADTADDSPAANEPKNSSTPTVPAPRPTNTTGIRISLHKPITAEKPLIDTCVVVNETYIEDATQIQDQSIFYGDGPHAGDVLAQYRKRRAKRRTGKRITKQPWREIPGEAENSKRMKVEKTESYMVEYMRLKEEGLAAAEPIRQHTKGKSKRKKLERMLREVDELKKKLAEIEQAKDREKEELDRKKEEDEKRMRAEIERIRREGMEENRRMEEQLRKQLALKNENEQAKEAVEKSYAKKAPAASGVRCARRTETYDTAALVETLALANKSGQQKESGINDFFIAAKKEHIEKINQTMMSRTILSERGDLGKPKATFNKVVHRPQPAIINVDYIKPHSLYKQSIDVQSISGCPRDYVPQTIIPFYSTEDEFESEEKRFLHAPFTRDPKLLYTVRKQSHDEIKQFFGCKRDIDVEVVFENVKNVTNSSPNKFVRKG